MCVDFNRRPNSLSNFPFCHMHFLFQFYMVLCVYLRGDFLENRVFLAKSAQNLVTKPAEENPLAAIIFSSKFSKICENLKNFTGSLAT